MENLTFLIRGLWQRNLNICTGFKAGGGLELDPTISDITEAYDFLIFLNNYILLSNDVERGEVTGLSSYSF